MADGLDYLLSFSTAIAAVDPNGLADVVFEQMVDGEACTRLDERVVRTAVFHAYAALLGGASLTADVA